MLNENKVFKSHPRGGYFLRHKDMFLFYGDWGFNEVNNIEFASRFYDVKAINECVIPNLLKQGITNFVASKSAKGAGTTVLVNKPVKAKDIVLWAALTETVTRIKRTLTIKDFKKEIGA